MKIESIHLHSVGPIEKRRIELADQWEGGLHRAVLFSGCNGSGKSTVFRAVAHLWTLAGQWLSTPRHKAKMTTPSVRWLSRWQAAAVVLESVPEVGRLGIFFGEPGKFEALRDEYPELMWLGETREDTGRPGRPAKLLLHKEAEALEALASRYRTVFLNDSDELPNMVYLDGEDRRWVTPTKGLGEVVPDDPQLRWLVGYRANEEWKGQLEASLLALKTVNPGKFQSVLADLNALLAAKNILPEPDKTTLRLRVQLSGSGGEHSLDDLSAGEHQVLIQLYLVSRFLKPGGIVLIDEPDLHLHPSLVASFLSRLEAQVKARDGQLLLTSHNPAIWERYENQALRVQLDHGGVA